MNKTDCKKVKSIKLIVVGMLFLFILCGMAFAEASNSADAVVDLIKAEYNRYDYETETEFVDIRFRVTNQLSESKTFEPYVAFYTSQNQLRDFKFANAQTISANGSAEFLVESDVSIEEEGIYVKVFVWDDNYAPCADIVPYSIDKGNTTLSVAGTTIENKSFGTLTITEQIGDGEVTLNNVSVRELIIEGGGSNSIKLKGCTVHNKITAQKKSGNAPRILLENTPVDKIDIIEPAIIEAVDTTSVISEIVTVEEVKIQGENTRVKKLEIDENAESKITITVPESLEAELEINSDKGIELNGGTADNFEFSTAREDIANEIFESIKDIVSHIHIWKEEAEVTLGYKTYKCSCSEIKNPSDRVISFNVSDFASFDSSAGEIDYFSDKANGIMIPVRLDIDPEKASDFILYNGSALESKNPADYIGVAKLIDVNSKYSGRVVLIDNDFEAGYDIISIEMPVYGVVDEVKSNGRVVFKNALNNPMGGRCGALFVSGADCNSVLTKNGKIISGSELKENDVLSVIWNPNKDFYYVEVVDNKIEGSVTMTKASLTSAGGVAYCLNTEDEDGFKIFYDVGYNAYNNATIKLGAEGTFVIDKYDKIVAFFKPTSNMHSNYGYVLAATAVADDWGNPNVKILILDDSNEVYETYLAQEVEISNYVVLGTIGSIFNGAYYDYSCDVFETQDFVEETGAPTFAAAIQNQLITYEANAEGKIDTIGFATTSEDVAEEQGWLYQARYSTTGNSYDQEESQLIANARFNITENTLVFCINGDDNLDGLGDTEPAIEPRSGVMDKEILSKISETTPVAVYDVNDSDEASVVLIYNVDYEREETEEDVIIPDGGYGYVLASTYATDEGGNTIVIMQILDDSGEVYEAWLAKEAEFTNYDGHFGTIGYDILNTLIKYEANDDGRISSIEVATTSIEDAEENGWLYLAAYAVANNTYDDTTKKVTVDGKQFTLTEDTKVYFINGLDGWTSLELGSPSYASKTVSMVTKIGSIGTIDSTTPVAVYDVNENNEVAVVVLYNRIAGISPNANVAVIDFVGTAVENGQRVEYFEYFMNGEKKAATTDVNVNGWQEIVDVTQGDVFMFAFDESGKKIIAAKKCFDISERYYDGNTAVMINTDWFAEAIANVRGAGFVVGYTPAVNRISFADADDLSSYDSIYVGNANVYVFDQNKIANKLYVGSAADINIDEDVIEKTSSQYITDRNGNIIVDTNDSVVGLLDYVAAFKNADGEVIDVVIYKPYDFGIYYVY